MQIEELRLDGTKSPTVAPVKRKIHPRCRRPKSGLGRLAAAVYYRWECVSGAFIVRMMIRPYLCGNYESIQIASCIIGDDTEAFAACVRQALALIQRTDSYAWRMVVREIDYVVNDYLISGANYHRRSRACSVDFGRHQVPRDTTAREYAWHVASIACSIVHEATHGRIYAFGIPYTAATWERIEKLCVRQQQRFAKRQLSIHYDFKSLVKPFDPERWRPFQDRRARRRMAREMWLRFRSDVKKESGRKS